MRAASVSPAVPRGAAARRVPVWMRTAVVLVLLALLLSACGFRPRGAVAIPAEFQPIQVQSGGLVGDALEARMQGSTVRLSDAPGEAGLVLRILSQTRGSRVVAVDRDGKALAFGLSYRVRFDALDAAGEPLMPEQSLTLERTFDDNPDVSVLGKQLESDIIYQDMAADAADQVLLRLRAALAGRGGG